MLCVYKIVINIYFNNFKVIVIKFYFRNFIFFYDDEILFRVFDLKECKVFFICFDINIKKKFMYIFVYLVLYFILIYYLVLMVFLICDVSILYFFKLIVSC